MVAIAPGAMDGVEYIVGGYFILIGTLRVIQYILYLYKYMKYDNLNRREHEILLRNKLYYTGDGVLIYPTIYSIFFNVNESKDLETKRINTVMRSRSHNKSQIFLVNIGGCHVVEKGKFRLFPILYFLLIPLGFLVIVLW